jgi:N-methylhydantoinase A/acetophenone carboxylase
MGYTIDIDTGGTFTDGVFMDGGRSETVKVLTTQHDLTACFFECIRAGASRFGVAVDDLLYKTDVIRFSNTIGTNTIIQRDGSKIGLLVTAGREHLAPATNRGSMPALLQKDMIAGIEEDVSPSGDVIKVPDEQAVLASAQMLIDRGVHCLVVVFANSEFNPANERFVRHVIKREYPNDYLGSLPVFLSSDITSRTGEKERINAAVLNAYIHAKLVRLLYKAGDDLRQRLYRRNLFIVHNNGTVARVSKTRAIQTLNSGPTAGLLGSQLIGNLYKADNLISMDMGGTSLDVGYVRQGQASFTLNPDIEGFPINIPMFSIRAIGAGGGSIASFQKGKLQVGPQSAGALPGPVCFSLGGMNPTVTDADLLLGIFDPDYFLGGAMKLNQEQAKAVVQDKIASRMGISVQEAALAIRKKIDETMGREIGKIRKALMQHVSPLLVVYGGAGPAHCCHVAKLAGLKQIVITPYSAVFSAFSSSSMDVGHVYDRRVTLPLGEGADLAPLDGLINGMRREAERDMRGEGFPIDRVTFTHEIYVKGADADQELKLSVEPDFYKDPKTISAVCQQAAKALADHGAPAADVTLTMVSLQAQAGVPHHTFVKTASETPRMETALRGTRSVYLESELGFQDVPVYDRRKIICGHQGKGPMLIESDQTTIFVLPQWKMNVDEYNNMFLEAMS